MPHSVWRRVRARVHLSLTPVELSNPVRSATKKAFSSLLMRYSPELGGAVVAHIGPVELCGPPAFIDASPFPHVAAIANLLVFAPTKGAELLGVVTHVGPDHLGLSVLSAFHAVLPIDDLEGVYRFESKYTRTSTVHMWKSIDGPDHITVRRQLRFVISELKPTRTGLFQIIASLDPNLRQTSNDSHPLGLIPREKEISLSTHSVQEGGDTVETEHADILQVTKRSSAGRANEHLTGDELLTAGNDMLGDALMPTRTPVSAVKKKKRRRSETEGRSVSFEDSERQEQDTQVHEASEQPRSQETGSQELDGSEEKGGGKKGVNDREKGEKSDRKKRKKDKKKKKNRPSSGDGDKRRESNGSIKATKYGNEEDEMDSSLPVEMKEEEQQQRATNDVTSTGNGEVRKDSKEQEGEERRSHRKKSKKKRREKGGTRDDDTESVIKTEEKVNPEISMRRDAEKAVELGPMGDEEKKDENEENERDTESSRKKKKKKKKRRRSSEGEADEHRSKKKKRKKRMSEAMELERKRSMHVGEQH